MDRKKEIKRINKIFLIILLMILIIVSSFIMIKKLYVEKTLTVSALDNVYDVLASEEDEYGAYYKDGKWYYTDDEENEVEIPTSTIIIEYEKEVYKYQGYECFYDGESWFYIDDNYEYNLIEESDILVSYEKTEYEYEGYNYIYDDGNWYLEYSEDNISNKYSIDMSQNTDNIIYAYDSDTKEYSSFIYDSSNGWVAVSVDYSLNDDELENILSYDEEDDENGDESVSKGTSYDISSEGDYTSFGITKHESTTILKSSSGGRAISTTTARSLYNRLKSDPLVYCNNHGSALPNTLCHVELASENVTANAYKAYVLASSNTDNTGSYAANGQKAWWGTGGGSTKKNANAFSNYISYMKTNAPGYYEFDKDGFNIRPEITFYEANGTSVEFRQSDQVFRIGPFKLSYDSYGSYAGIDGATLITNLGSNYTKGSDFWFEGSDEKEIDLPESGQTFYLVVKYDPNLTSITDLSFSYHYTNGYGTYNLYSGLTKQCPNCESYISYNNNYHYCNGTTNKADVVSIQGLVVVQSAAIYQVNLKTSWNGTIPSESLITINKEIVDSSGDRVNIDDTFYFDVYVSESGKTSDLTFFETLTVNTSSNGWGTTTSASIRWTDSSTKPYVVIVERTNSDYIKAMVNYSDCEIASNENIGNGNTVTGYIVYKGNLANYANSTLELDVQNVANTQLSDYIQINKKLVSSSGGNKSLLNNTKFTFKVYVWRNI